MKLNYVKEGAVLTPEQMLMVPPVGVLSVTLLRARGLMAKDDADKTTGVATSDPFAHVRIIDYRDREALDYESKVKPKTLDPEWNEKFYFRLTEKHKDLQARLMSSWTALTEPVLSAPRICRLKCATTTP